MGQAKVWRNSIAYSAALARARTLRWQRTLELHHAMGHGRPGRSTVTCSAAISTCKKARQWQRALELPCLRVHAELKRSTATYSAAVSACEEARPWQRALELLHVVGQAEMR